MEVTIINKEKYISSDILFNKAPVYCKLSRTARELVKKKKITDYIFAKLVDKKWTITDGKSYKFDKIFFKKTFVDSIPEINEEKVIVDDNNVELAPAIIHLKEHEKFKDETGNTLEIETRGERKVDGIYFKVKDVMTGFKMENIITTIIDKVKSGYIEGIHYKYFNCKKTENSQNKTNKAIKKNLYLTYEGMLRVLFASHSPNVKPFIKWATESLFAIQLGQIEDKDKLVSQIKGVSYETIQELFSINARSIPCVYLTAFNTVDKLRDVMKIDDSYKDDDVVYKFGLTKSFEKRKNGHRNEYKKLENLIDMKLVYYSYIDPLYISEAESEIKTLLCDHKIEWDDHDELVIIPNKLLKYIKTFYQNIGMKYSGHTQEFNKKIEELNKTIIEYENKVLMLTKSLEYEKIIFEEKLNNKDLLVENLKKELYIKDLEVKLKSI